MGWIGVSHFLFTLLSFACIRPNRSDTDSYVPTAVMHPKTHTASPSLLRKTERWYAPLYERINNHGQSTVMPLLWKFHVARHRCNRRVEGERRLAPAGMLSEVHSKHSSFLQCDILCIHFSLWLATCGEGWRRQEISWDKNHSRTAAIWRQKLRRLCVYSLAESEAC